MHPQIIKCYCDIHNLTEPQAIEEITKIILETADRVAPQFVFGFHTLEDIKQQCIVFALEVLSTDKYDVNRPLVNFIYTHMHNRIINFKRDNFIRAEPPCSCCDAFNPPEKPCAKWLAWSKRNFSKQSLMSLRDISSVSEPSSNEENEIEKRELERKIDLNLPIELRSDYLKMRSGTYVAKANKEKVREAIKEIINEQS